MKPMEVILFLIGFGSILFLSYVATKFLAKKSGATMKGKYLSVVETISLGMDKRIHLIRAGEKYILVASTSKTVEFLTTLEVEPEETTDRTVGDTGRNAFDFKALFDKYAGNYKNKKISLFRQDSDTSASLMEDDKFRYNLQKLKGITQKTNTQIEKDGDEAANEK